MYNILSTCIVKDHKCAVKTLKFFQIIKWKVSATNNRSSLSMTKELKELEIIVTCVLVSFY
jgi:hypothetical protein